MKKALFILISVLLSINCFSQFDGLGNFYADNIISESLVPFARTANLKVSEDGDGTDGLSWATAYTTIQAAIAVASSDVNDLTVIECAPGTYDINTTGDPTFAKNVEIAGSHRNWVMIENNHGSATSVMKFTAYVSLFNVTVCMGTGSSNGVIISGSGTKGSRVRKVYFESEHITGAHTGLEIATTEYIRLEDVMFHGVITHTTALIFNGMKLSDVDCIQSHDCLTGMQFINSADNISFKNILFHHNTLALDINSGDNQIFEDLQFFECTENIDDEVGNHQYTSLRGNFPVTLSPVNTTGVAITAGNGAYGGDTELRSAAAATKPFTVIAYQLDPSNEENTLIRLSPDSGTSFFIEAAFATKKNKASGGGSGTNFIFNAGTRISGSVWSPGAGRTVNVWLEIQEF